MSYNILIGGFVQSGDLDTARKVFDEMPIATWNAMVAGLTDFECNEEALRLFSEMHVLGFYPDEFTLGSVLRGCAGLNSLIAGRQVHTYAVKTIVQINVIVSSSLAHMYIKSKSLSEGEKVIKSMLVHTVVAVSGMWNLALHACLNHFQWDPPCLYVSHASSLAMMKCGPQFEFEECCKHPTILP